MINYFVMGDGVRWARIGGDWVYWCLIVRPDYLLNAGIDYAGIETMLELTMLNIIRCRLVDPYD